MVGVARTSTHLDVFWVGVNGDIRATWWDASSGWSSSPESISSQHEAQIGAVIAVVARTSTHLDVFWAGANGDIRTNWWDTSNPNQAWGGVFSITSTGEAQAGAPVAVVACASTHLDVFWTTPNGAIDFAWWDASPDWSPVLNILS